jgi:hypothetical protein
VRFTTRFVVLCLVAGLGLLATGGVATATPKRITGKLNKPGYTVIALSANDKVGAVRARDGRFKLRPPAGRVTLHLRSPNGTYAGPIVVGRNGKRAIVGVMAGAKLGKVKVSTRRGYAKTAEPLPESALNARRTAKAKNRVPIGARVFGRVRSRVPRDPIRGDFDLDGVEDALDIDDDGDLILDDVDGSPAARAGGQVLPPPPLAGVLSKLYVGSDNTANANVPGSTDDQIEAVATAFGRLQFSVPDGAEIDCGGSPNQSPPPPWVGGLPYCTLGGTGTAPSATPPDFPECCDADGDGYGVVPLSAGFDIPTTILPTTPLIKTGDELLIRFNDAGGVETGAASVMLPYVFATVPALVSYHDTAGHSATIAYPLPPGAPEFPVAAGPDGQVRVTMTIWRPQRRPTSEAECAQPPAPLCVENEWIDIGGLTYGVAHEGRGPCQPGAYSEDDPTTPVIEDDPNLALTTGATDEGTGLTDTREPPDQPTNPQQTLTFTVNLTQCTSSSAPWPPGETRRIRLNATPPTSGGRAIQILEFKHE